MLLNHSRAQELMGRDGVDVLVLTQPNNFLYFSDFTQVNSFSFIDRPAICLFFADPSMEPVAIIPRWNLEAFVQTSWITDVVVYAEHAAPGSRSEAGGWRRALRTALTDRTDARTVGVEEKAIPKWIMDEVTAGGAGRTVRDCSELIRRIRAVKTAAELHHLRAATQVLEIASAAMLAAAHTGVTEAELAAAFRASVGRQGAEGIKNFVLGFGRETVITHKLPASRRLAEGDLIRFDLGALVHGYHADNARSYVWGAPSAAQERLYAAVMNGQTQGEALLTTRRDRGRDLRGNRGRPAAGSAPGAPGARGTRHRREHHESPALIHGNTQTLEPNMVINLETLYHDPEHGAFAVEDTYLITADGHERWTHLSRELGLAAA